MVQTAGRVTLQVGDVSVTTHRTYKVVLVQADGFEFETEAWLASGGDLEDLSQGAVTIFGGRCFIREPCTEKFVEMAKRKEKKKKDRRNPSVGLRERLHSRKGQWL